MKSLIFLTVLLTTITVAECRLTPTTEHWWTCSYCGYSNPAGIVICDKCGHHKP
ncbi:MAG: hypothetical protein KDK60_01340 [Chlamydiia bacterium]|nr:hypothetical protein [Chlamydiia bacterium]